jgi:hypothetical protein
MVDRIPGGSHVNIHGCVRGDAWCDVSWAGDRGWVSSRYLESLYRNRYVYVPDYINVIDLPIVPFEIGSYWSTYYAGRPWYHRRAYWESYWRSHEQYAYQGPGYRTGRFGTVETRPGRIGTAETRTGRFGTAETPTGRFGTAETPAGRAGPGVTTGLAGRQGAANIRGEQGNLRGEHGRIAHMNGANRNLTHAQAPIARGHEASHFATAPNANRAVSHAAQPSTVGRAGGPPTNAHAQVGGGHGPAMPHGGGAPAHVGGAAHVGGGAPAGGPPGHEKH